MKNSVAFIVCALLSLSQSRGQTVSGDSTPDPSVIRKVDSLNELAFYTKRNDLAKAFAQLNSANGLAIDNNYDKGLATNLLYEAGIYQQNGYLKRALSVYSKSLEISKRIKDTFNIARANQQIASALQASGKITEAQNLYNTAMGDFKRLKKDDEVINTKNSIGNLFLEQNDFTSARGMFYDALRGSKETGYKYGEKKSLYNLGSVNRKEGNIETAKLYFDSSLKINEQLDDKYGMSLNNLALAEVSNHEAKFDDAISYATSALDNAKSIKAFVLIKQSVNSILFAYKKQNNLEKVVAWQDTLIETEKELTENEKSYAINFIDILKEQQDKQFKVQEKQSKDTMQSSWQTILLFIVVIALITLSLLSYLWYKNYKRAELYSHELAEKNLLIEKNSLSMDLLNKTMSKQNFRLEESNLMKDKLLSIISHDLRHPLVNTKGILELVNLNLVNPQETKQLLGQLESQYLRSLTLLDNLLFWIRGQMKGEMIDKVRINLNQLMEDLIEDHKIPLQNKRITARNEVQDNLSVLGDKEMLKIIFRNLLSNAIKFTPQEGEILVYSSNEQGPAIHIKDSGVGMDSETLSKVNAKQYFTTRGTGNEAGSGFGLMLCHDLIEKHNGALTVKSEPGRGSTFTVQLPATPLK